MRRITTVALGLVWLVGGLLPLSSQISEHESHHPANTPAAAGMGSESKSMSREMEGMMRQMLNPPPKELYPTLMSLPELTAKQRADIEREAHGRMTTGTRQMSQGLSRMPQLVERKDYKALQSATEQVRQGLAQFESGLAAHRALAEGKAPKAIALEWFRLEMSLPAPISPQSSADGTSALPGWFHPTVMALLIGFAALMVGMYFFKMHRAAMLLGSLNAPGAVVAAAPPPSVEIPQVPAPVPVPSSWSGELRVARIFQETPDVKTLRLTGLRDGEFPFTFEPGQFLAVAAPIAGKVIKRSYSIASSPCCHGWCDITVKHAPGGIVSGFLHESLKEGDRLQVEGPWGRFTFRGPEALSVVLIAGGVGITPLMSSIRYLTDQSWPGRIDLIYACASERNIIFREELEYRRRHPNLHVTIVLSKEESPNWTGRKGHITKELLQEVVPDLANRRIHLCGPPAMMAAVQADLTALGVNPRQVHTELFIAPETKVAEVQSPAQIGTYKCAFARSNKSVTAKPGRTVLETAEENGVQIDYSCRQGYCGVCKVKLLAGSVSMAVEEGLAPDEKSTGMVLACQAIPKTDVRVDA